MSPEYWYLLYERVAHLILKLVLLLVGCTADVVVVLRPVVQLHAQRAQYGLPESRDLHHTFQPLSVYEHGFERLDLGALDFHGFFLETVRKLRLVMTTEPSFIETETAR